MTAGSQFHNVNFVIGKLCGQILSAEESKIEMGRLRKSMDQSKEGATGIFSP